MLNPNEIRREISKEIQQNYSRHFQNIIFILMLSYAWETMGHYFELSDSPLLQSLFGGGPEFWANRLIADHLSVLTGYYIAFRFRKIRFYGAFFVIIYLIALFTAYSHGAELSHAYTDSLLPLWGDKRYAMFDFWSLIHIFTGTVFGSFVIWWNQSIPKRLKEATK